MTNNELSKLMEFTEARKFINSFESIQHLDIIKVLVDPNDEGFYMRDTIKIANILGVKVEYFIMKMVSELRVNTCYYKHPRNEVNFTLLMTKTINSIPRHNLLSGSPTYKFPSPEEINLKIEAVIKAINYLYDCDYIKQNF